MINISGVANKLFPGRIPTRLVRTSSLGILHLRSLKLAGTDNLQDKGIVISELKKLIEKLKGKSVDTKFEKSSVIRQSDAFKSQRPSVLGKPTTFLNSFVRKDFSKSTSLTQNNVSNDFSKPVTAQTLSSNKKSILKNTNVLAPEIYKIHTDHKQSRTSQLPQDSWKTNKRVSFSTGVTPTTSVSRPKLKSNPQGHRVLRNSSQGKKHEVEDQRRNVKLSKNKTPVTACNDSLNALTLNVKSVSAMCDKCVLHHKHDMCVLNSVAKPIKKIVAFESNQKPRNFSRKLYERISKTCSWWKPRNNVRKLYERVSKTCSWWYSKFTPSGYMWKPKSPTGNVNPNVKRSRLSHINVNNGKSKEFFNKQTTLLEKRMDESILLDKQCQSSLEIFKVKLNVNTIITGVELCKQKIANRTYIGYIDPFIQSTIESNFCLVISRISARLNQFLRCLNEEMVADLSYFNSLESEVDSLRSQLETKKTQFLNEIDRLSREYFYADHMNAILGVYTELDEVTNLQCDYLELLDKCKGLEIELSKRKM
nr:hypothetical protein [Tanacetum cinerariifolium]